VVARNLSRPGRPGGSSVEPRGARWTTDQAELAFALAFTRISASGQDALQDAVLMTLEEASAATVLIALESIGGGLALKRDLERLGRPAFCVSSAMEAIRFFELRNAVSVVLVDEAFADDPTASLLRTLASQQPRVLRVLLSAKDSTLHAEAEEVLAMPWMIDDLRRLLRLRARNTYAQVVAPPSALGSAG
jgi:hypothetical protein